MWSLSVANLEEPWPTSQQRWPVARPAYSERSWGGWRCQAGCCHSRRRECPALWLSAGIAWWGPAAACIWEQVSGPPLEVKGSSLAGCCSGSPSNGSTSWFCELRKKKETGNGKVNRSRTKHRWRSISAVHLPGSCRPSDTCGSGMLGSFSAGSCL